MGASGVTTTLLGAAVGDAQQAPFPWKLVLLCSALAWCAVRALEWAWWRPRRLARVLRSQGLRGTAYRSLAGDAPLTERLNREARSRPLPLGCHDVAPRAMPLFHQTMKEHGTALLQVAFLSCRLLSFWARTPVQSLPCLVWSQKLRGQQVRVYETCRGQLVVLTEILQSSLQLIFL
jgi:hypothetical protein